jgi:flagellar biosynthesis/type III secretory pathway chaperone
MTKSESHVNNIESLFVSELRACQALLELTQEERFALTRDDVAYLLQLAADKETVLDQLAKVEKAKFSALSELGISSESTGGGLGKPTLSNLLTRLEREVASNLLHIQEGTLVVMDQVREFTLINRALTLSALERASIRQADLLRAYRSPLEEREPRFSSSQTVAQTVIEPLEITSYGREQEALPEIFAAIIAARDAIQGDDPEAIATAVGSLQEALEGISGYLEMDAITLRGGPAADDLDEGDASAEQADLSSASIVEQIANLYHQENAYQASLEVSDRMLALV